MFNYSEKASTALEQYDIKSWEKFYANKVRGRQEMVSGYLRFVNALASKKLPPIFEEKHLSHLLGVPLKELRYLTSGSSSLYREFSIPKRSGGFRNIAAPIGQLAHAQRWLDFNIFRKIPISDRAFGYVKGRSNLDNAIQHIGCAGVLHLDLVNFFHAIEKDQVSKILVKQGYPPIISDIVSRLCTHHGCLPQGAPSSPQIANLCFRQTDAALEARCNEEGLIYTRYVDDICVSGDITTLKNIMNSIESICENNGFFINRKKTFIQQKTKKIVTGVSISTGIPSLPRAKKRRFAFEIFSTIKEVELHRISSKDPMFIERAEGLLGYWLHIEPENRQALRLRNRLGAALRASTI